MARTTKTTKATTTTASTPAPVQATVVKKTKTAVKQETAVKPAKTETKVEVKSENTIIQVDEVETATDSLVDASNEFLAKLQQINSMISSLKTEYRVLEKKWTRELKAAQKLSSKKKRKAGNRAPSGFVKPTKISDELAKFLDKPLGSEMARTEVTRDINKYIRSNNLQDSSNGRKINADSKLAQLLKLNTTDELTYFNLQRFMSPHFQKASEAAAAAAAAAASTSV